MLPRRRKPAFIFPSDIIKLVCVCVSTYFEFLILPGPAGLLASDQAPAHTWLNQITLKLWQLQVYSLLLGSTLACTPGRWRGRLARGFSCQLHPTRRHHDQRPAHQQHQHQPVMQCAWWMGVGTWRTWAIQYSSNPAKFRDFIRDRSKQRADLAWSWEVQKKKKSRIDVFYHRFGNGIPGHTARAPMVIGSSSRRPWSVTRISRIWLLTWNIQAMILQG
jgi:hypothetical protein